MADYCRACDQPLSAGAPTCSSCGTPTKAVAAKFGPEKQAKEVPGANPPPDAVYLDVGGSWKLGARTYIGAALATDQFFYIIYNKEYQATEISGLLASASEMLSKAPQPQEAPHRIPYALIGPKLRRSKAWPLGKEGTKALEDAASVEIIPKAKIEALKIPWMATLELKAYGLTYRFEGGMDKNMVREYLTEWGYALA